MCITCASDDFILIKGGTFKMGSPESENWHGNDETQRVAFWLQ